MSEKIFFRIDSVLFGLGFQNNLKGKIKSEILFQDQNLICDSDLNQMQNVLTAEIQITIPRSQLDIFYCQKTVVISQNKF